MISGCTSPANAFGGVAPQTITTTAINGSLYPLREGDVVCFDLSGMTSLDTFPTAVVADLLRFDKKFSGFNVVGGRMFTRYDSTLVDKLRAGVFAVVTKGGNVGQRVVVCVRGVCTPRVVYFRGSANAATTIAKGNTLFVNDVTASPLASALQAEYLDPDVDRNGSFAADPQEFCGLTTSLAGSTYTTAVDQVGLGILLTDIALPLVPTFTLTSGYRGYVSRPTVLFDGIVFGSNRG
jgi:hypothetical protein